MSWLLNFGEMNEGAKGMAKGVSKDGKRRARQEVDQKELERLRWELRKLLSMNVGINASGIGARKKGFFVVGANIV